VRQVADRAKELAQLPNELPQVVKPAFMVERVQDPSAERKVEDACRRLQVLRFKRSGHAIRVVGSLLARDRHCLRRL
jgi:hypothetical protein